MLTLCRKAIGTGLFLVTVVLTSAALMACSSESEALPDETGESNAARLLRGIPSKGIFFAFAEIEKVMRRPAMRQEVEWGFEDLSERSRGLIGLNMLANGNIKSFVFAVSGDEIDTTTIMSGDFEGLPEALRETVSVAEANSTLSSPREVDPYRGLEVFVFPCHHDLFIAVPDSKTLLLADNEWLLSEAIDRHLDGGELHPYFADMFNRVETVDFLVAIAPNAQIFDLDDTSSPPLPVFQAYTGHLNEGGTSTVFAYREYAEDGQAEEALELQSSRPDLGGLFFSYKRDTVIPSGELWRDGRALIARAVVPDEDVADLFLAD